MSSSRCAHSTGFLRPACKRRIPNQSPAAGILGFQDFRDQLLRFLAFELSGFRSWDLCFRGFGFRAFGFPGFDSHHTRTGRQGSTQIRVSEWDRDFGLSDCSSPKAAHSWAGDPSVSYVSSILVISLDMSSQVTITAFTHTTHRHAIDIISHTSHLPSQHCYIVERTQESFMPGPSFSSAPKQQLPCSEAFALGVKAFLTRPWNHSGTLPPRSVWETPVTRTPEGGSRSRSPATAAATVAASRCRHRRNSGDKDSSGSRAAISVKTTP